MCQLPDGDRKVEGRTGDVWALASPREGSHAVASSTGLRGFLQPRLSIYPSEHRTRSQAFLTTEPARQRREKDPRFLVH